MGLIGTTKKLYNKHGFNFVYANFMYKIFRKGDIEYNLKWKGHNVKGNNRVACWATFNEVLTNGSYDFPVKNAKTIVDLGANIGLSTIFFKDKYPNSKVICVEPADENLDFLYENIIGLKDSIYVERKPIWSKKTELVFSAGECSSSDYFGEGTGEVKYKTITMPKLMKAYGFEKIDILKIDIEGWEIPVLTENNEWLENVNNIFIEIHSMVHAGLGSVEHAPKIFKALDVKGFELKQMKEGLYWFEKIKFKKSDFCEIADGLK